MYYIWDCITSFSSHCYVETHKRQLDSPVFDPRGNNFEVALTLWLLSYLALIPPSGCSLGTFCDVYHQCQSRSELCLDPCGMESSQMPLSGC
jgi:hypothetical protein